MEEFRLNHSACLGISHLTEGLTENLFIPLELVLQRDFTFENSLLKFSKLLVLGNLSKEIYASRGLCFILNEVVDEGGKTKGFSRNSDSCLLGQAHSFTDGKLIFDCEIEGLSLEVSHIQISSVQECRLGIKLLLVISVLNF